MKAIQPYNYSTHAIEEITPLLQAERAGHKGYGLGPDALVAVSKLLDQVREAPKFMLPDYGRFVENWIQAMPSQLRMPFDIVVLEFGAPLFTGDDTDFKMRSSKRIVLAYQDKEDTGFVFIWPIFWVDGYQRWAPCPFIGRISMNREGDVVAMDVPDHLKDSAKAVTNLEGFSLCMSVQALSSEVHNHMLALANYDKQEFFRNAISDLREEALATAQFIEAMSCCNVSTSAVQASKALNKKRHAHKKVPFFDYHLLMLDPFEEHAQHPLGQGGHHASPRLHLRRGHIRFYRKNSKRVFVRSHFVGDPAKGVVAKDYLVKGSVSGQEI